MVIFFRTVFVFANFSADWLKLHYWHCSNCAPECLFSFMIFTVLKPWWNCFIKQLLESSFIKMQAAAVMPICTNRFKFFFFFNLRFSRWDLNPWISWRNPCWWIIFLFVAADGDVADWVLVTVMCLVSVNKLLYLLMGGWWAFRKSHCPEV